MKTTSYEISKQLAEAGFKQETDFYWAKWNEGDPELVHAKDGTPSLIEKVLAWDLETILKALPKQHDLRRGIGMYELRIWYHEGKAFIGYQNFNGFDKVMTLEQEQNESLADIAARLLILLESKGLINFKE